MSNIALKAKWRDGKFIFKEKIPFKEDMEVMVIFMNSIPQNELYVHSQEVQEALIISEKNYKQNNFKEFSNVDELIKELENG